jgi:hypothetical protein
MRALGWVDSQYSRKVDRLLYYVDIASKMTSQKIRECLWDVRRQVFVF